jgi:hypothetical protein
MGEARDKLPSFEGIILRDVQIYSPGKITLDGFDVTHRLGITFENVFIDDAPKVPVKATHADITVAQVNFFVSGDDVHVKEAPGSHIFNRCEGKFVPFPEGN